MTKEKVTDITLKMVEDARDELIEEHKKPSPHPVYVVSLEDKEKIDKITDSDYFRSYFVAVGDFK